MDVTLGATLLLPPTTISGESRNRHQGTVLLLAIPAVGKMGGLHIPPLIHVLCEEASRRF